METVTKRFHARLANRPFLAFDIRALWRFPELMYLFWEDWAKVG